MNNSPNASSDLATQELHSVTQLEPGSLLLDRFRITEKLGKGAQAFVYQAYDELLETDIAIKIVQGDSDLPLKIQQLRNEVLLARRIQHPSIIQIHDVFCDGDLVFFTMALVSGRPLMEYLHESISTAQFEQWSVQLLSAVSACQQHDLIHGDIKPDNIMITPDDNLLLIDFGIGNAASGLGQTSGHPDYAAPEVMQSGKTSLQSDTYSAGKVLQQLLDNVRLSSFSPAATLWRLKQQKRLTKLTHPVAEQRADPLSVSQSFSATKDSIRLSLGIVGTVLLFIIIAMMMRNKDIPTIVNTQEKPVWQLALIEDKRTPLLTRVSEMLYFPLQSDPGLAVVANEHVRKLSANLALNPFENRSDRSRMASTLGADIVVLIQASDMNSQTLMLQADALVMPANSLLFSVNQSVSLESMASQLNQFAVSINAQFRQLRNKPEQAVITDFLTNLPFDQLQNRSLEDLEVIHLLQAETPNFPGVWIAGAELAWQQGDIANLQEQLNQLEKTGTQEEYWLLLGQYFQAQIDDNPLLAMQSVDRLITLFPGRADLLRKRADVHLWQNDVTAAIDDFRQALSFTPYNGEIWFEVGKLRIMQGEIKEAIAHELTQALTAFRSLGDISGEGLVLNAFGVAHLRLAEYDVAERYFRDALVLRDAQTQPSERATTLANLANVAAINRRFDVAEQSLEEASELLRHQGDHEKQAHVLDTLGFILEEQGRYTEALAFYKKGLDIRVLASNDNKKAESMSNVAYMHFLTGNFSLAQIFWQQAETLFKRVQDEAFLIRTWQNLAQLSLAKGDMRKAGDYLYQVTEKLDAQHTEADMINRLLFSYLHFHQGKLAPAIDNLNAAKSLAQETGDSKALTEIQLWHAELCLNIADFICLTNQLGAVNPSFLNDSLEQKAVFHWLTSAKQKHDPTLTADQQQLLNTALQYGPLPLMTEIKILLDLQERFRLPDNSELMQKVRDKIKPVYHSAWLHWLYLNAQQPDIQTELEQQLLLSSPYWRSHLYYTALPGERARETQSELQQQWLAQLTEAQSNLYKEWYFD